MDSVEKYGIDLSMDCPPFILPFQGGWYVKLSTFELSFAESVRGSNILEQ